MNTAPMRESNFCLNPNFFDSVLRPAVERRLPAVDSFSGKALDHISGIRPFFETVSKDLCDDGRMASESAESAVSFISRSATSAAIVGGTIGLATLGIVVGSPLAAVGAGLLGLAVLPPLAERAAFGILNFAGELLQRVPKQE
jgi:hypothetical protein